LTWFRARPQKEQTGIERLAMLISEIKETIRGNGKHTNLTQKRYKGKFQNPNSKEYSPPLADLPLAENSNKD